MTDPGEDLKALVVWLRGMAGPNSSGDNMLTRAADALDRLASETPQRGLVYHIDANSFLCGYFARQDSKGRWLFDPPSGKAEEKGCAALDAFIEWWKPNEHVYEGSASEPLPTVAQEVPDGQ